MRVECGMPVRCGAVRPAYRFAHPGYLLHDQRALRRRQPSHSPGEHPGGKVIAILGGAIMKCTFKAAVAALILAVGVAGSVAAGPLDDAEAAYKRGDYATALRLLRPLAEQGEAKAHMYGAGRGVPQDYAAAVNWYRKAADQGFVYDVYGDRSWFRGG
jgi:hypothetical protein